jgi:hypothetical protein
LDVCEDVLAEFKAHHDPLYSTFSQLIQSTFGLHGGTGRSGRWHRTRLWATSKDPDFVPKRAHVVEVYTAPPAGATVLYVKELGPVTSRNFSPAPGWSADGHRIKAPLDFERGLEKVWVCGAQCFPNRTP